MSYVSTPSRFTIFQTEEPRVSVRPQHWILRHQHLIQRKKVWTRFPSEGSKYTPPHSSCEFKLKDYCPLVFRSLRKLFKVDSADYMLSICGNDALRELSSPGEPDCEPSFGPRLSRADMDQLLLDPSRWASIKLGKNMPARVERIVRRNKGELQLVGELTGEFYDVIMFFGVIDILQDYGISKKLEHAYKSIQYDPTSISAVDPKQYSKRFRYFVYKIIFEES
ncbi:hypothetical protein ACFE04_016560 [Oxalis oulophora]